MRRCETLTKRRCAQVMLLAAVVAAAGCASSVGTSAPRTPPPAQTTTPTVTTAPSPEMSTVPAATTAPSPIPTGTAGATSVTHATPMGAATPVRLRIPSIHVDSDLMGLGLQVDGTLEVPPTGFPAGWYTGAPTPGELGPAIIAGHVDWGGDPGVFFELRDLVPGDGITVTRLDGSTARFRVDRVEHFAKAQFPTDLVYADLDHAGLRLITCGGDFDQGARSYEDNLVVFATLIGPDARR